MIKLTYMKFRKYLCGDGRATRSEYWTLTVLSVAVIALMGCVVAFLITKQSTTDWLVMSEEYVQTLNDPGPSGYRVLF